MKSMMKPLAEAVQLVDRTLLLVLLGEPNSVSYRMRPALGNFEYQSGAQNPYHIQGWRRRSALHDEGIAEETRDHQEPQSGVCLYCLNILVLVDMVLRSI